MALHGNINDLEGNKFKKEGKQRKLRQFSVRTSKENFQNKLVTAKTTIGTSATKINFPEEDCEHYEFIHRGSGVTVYIGDSTVTTATGVPIEEDEFIKFYLKKGNDNDVYGVVSASTQDVFTWGVTRE